MCFAVKAGVCVSRRPHSALRCSDFRVPSCVSVRFWESLGVAEGKDLGLEGVAFNSDGNVLLVQRSVDPTSYTCTIVECTVTGDFVRCVLPLGQIVRPAASRVIKFAATSLTAAVCIVSAEC